MLALWWPADVDPVVKEQSAPSPAVSPLEMQINHDYWRQYRATHSYRSAPNQSRQGYVLTVWSKLIDEKFI